MPVHLTELDRGRAGATFDQMAQSIAGYEASAEVTPFTSKFDAVLAGKAQFTPREQAGYALFRALVSFMQTLTALVSERHGCDIDRAATQQAGDPCSACANRQWLALREYSAVWAETAFGKAGIKYVPPFQIRSEMNKSQLYLEALPLFMRQAISLPNGGIA